MSEQYQPLSDSEKKLLQRLFSNPDQFPKEFWAAVKKKVEADPPSFISSDLLPGTPSLQGANIETDAPINWRQANGGYVFAAIKGEDDGSGGHGLVAESIYTDDSSVNIAQLGIAKGTTFDTATDRALIRAVHWQSLGNRIEAVAYNDAGGGIQQRVVLGSDGQSNFIQDRNNGTALNSGIIDCFSGYWHLPSINADSWLRIIGSDATGVFVNTGGWANSASGDNARIYFPRSGTYFIGISTYAYPVGAVGVQALLNGNGLNALLTPQINQVYIGNDVIYGGFSAHHIRHVNGGDYLQAQVYNTSGGDMYLQFSVFRLPV